MRSIVAMFGAAVVLGACSTAKDAENLQTLDVSFGWENTQACSSTPPAFDIGNVPAGTETLRFKMKDLDVPSYQHGGGTVRYTGDEDIPAGSFTYKGPCPPTGQHDYRWTVEALNAAGDTVLARGTATKAFPPK